MKRKSILCMLIVAVMSLTMIACGGEGSSGDANIYANDAYFRAKIGDNYAKYVVTDADKAEIAVANSELAVTDTYVEDFSHSYFATRLRPNYILDKGGVTFALGDSKGLKITHTAGGANDRVNFAGITMPNNSKYKLTINYTPTCANAEFSLYFGETLLSALGGSLNQPSSKEVDFIVVKVGDIMPSLNLRSDIAFGSATIDLASIGLLRQVSAPTATNASISFDANNANLAYTYTQNESIPEGASLIKWYAMSSTTHANMEYLSSFDNLKSISTLALDGMYLSAVVTPIAKKADSETTYLGQAVTTVSEKTVGNPLSYPKFVFAKAGDVFVEDFESVSKDNNISFTGEKAFVTSIDAIAGKSLKFDSEANAKIELQDITLNANLNHKLSFTAKALDNVTVSLNICFVSATGVKIDNAVSVSGGARQYVLPCVNVGAFADYAIQIVGVNTGSVLIDNLSIEVIDVLAQDLPAMKTNTGASVFEDFDDNTPLSGNGYEVSDNVNVAKSLDGALKYNSLVIKGAKDRGLNIAFKALKNNMSANGRYKLTFDYSYSINKPTGLYISYRGDVDESQVNTNVTNLGANADTKYSYSHTAQLGDHADYYFQFFFYGSTNEFTMVIDNLKLEYLGQPAVTKILPEGGMIEHDFDKLIAFESFEYGNNNKGREVDFGTTGKGLKLSKTQDGEGIALKIKDLAAVTLPVGSYKLEFDYNLISNAGAYFCVFLEASSTQQIKKENIFGTSPTKGNFSHTFVVTEAGKYYLNFFTLFAPAMEVDIDNIKFEHLVQSITDILQVGGILTTNFDDKVAFTKFEYPNGNTGAIGVKEGLAGKSLKLSRTSAGSGISTNIEDLKSLTLPIGKYRISFDYVIDSADGTYNNADLYLGINNSANLNTNVNSLFPATGAVTGNVSKDFDILAESSGTWIQIFSMASNVEFAINIDNIVMTRVS